MLNKLYHDLLAFYPMKPWWPGDSALETAVGTILTQNTSWKGVLKSIENLKNAQKLDLDALLETPDEELAERRARWKLPEGRKVGGYLARYAKMVSSADKGAIID